jgi:hypothetical protein
MPITFDWDNEAQTVLRVVATSSWNWNDFHKTLRRATFWLDSVQHPVEILVDLRATTRLPAGALGHIRSLGISIHPNHPNRMVILGLDSEVAVPLGGKEGTYSDGTRLLRFVDANEAAQTVLEAWLAE